MKKEFQIKSNLHQSIIFCCLFMACTFFQTSLYAIVNFEKGRMEVMGVQLLQDSDDENKYYYLPQYPKIATNEAGNLEFMFIKYVGGAKEDNGGLFHTLVQFDLPQEIIELLEEKLKEENSKAIIAGPVPMFQTAGEEGESALAKFKVVSSILEDKKGENAFTKTFETSGHAPLLKGSKAAIAAKLNQAGATLLWESMKGAASDVSVMVSGYYEAKVQAYGATISAEVNTIYEHFSKLKNKQEKFKRDQIREVTDELIQNQTFSIDVFDRGESLGISNEKMESLVDVVTTQLTNQMFDAETGWAKLPETEVFIEEGQIPNRQKRGWLSRIFGGMKDKPYISDNQFVLKEREDMRSFKFYLNLNKSTVIKVPFYSTGNIGGVFFRDNSTVENKYFNVVNLDDPDFQSREINFILDANYVGAYNKVLNFISISFLKEYDNNQFDVVKDIKFDRTRLENKGVLPEVITYPRLGLSGDKFRQYKYKVKYSLAGGRGEITMPANEEWFNSTASDINLVPPYLKTEVTIDLDRQKIDKPVSIQMQATINGQQEKQESLVLRPTDEVYTNTVSVFHDKHTRIICLVDWHIDNVPIEELTIDNTYLLLNPPKK